MPALPAQTTSYLTAVKNSLSVGKALGSNVSGAAQNYLRARDMSTVLDLLQDGLDQPANLTATGGSATSVVDGAATFVASQQIGNLVLFAGNVTATLAGISARVVNNTTTALFFADAALPGTPAAGDTYTIVGGMLDTQIVALRQGKGLAESPPGSVYGDNRTVMDGLILAIKRISGADASYRQVWSGNTLTGSTTTSVNLNLRGGVLLEDQLRGLRLRTPTLGERIIQRNTPVGVLTLSGPLTGAPGVIAVTIIVPDDAVGGTSPKIRVHAGAQPGENAVLADLIQQLETAVVAYTLPT